MQAAQAIGSEERFAGALGLDRRPDPLQLVQHLLPESRRALRVGRKQGKVRTARKRLAERHPRPHPMSLGPAADLAENLGSTRLGGEGGRLAQQLLVIFCHG